MNWRICVRPEIHTAYVQQSSKAHVYSGDVSCFVECVECITGLRIAEKFIIIIIWNIYARNVLNLYMFSQTESYSLLAWSLALFYFMWSIQSHIIYYETHSTHVFGCKVSETLLKVQKKKQSSTAEWNMLLCSQNLAQFIFSYKVWYAYCLQVHMWNGTIVHITTVPIVSPNLNTWCLVCLSKSLSMCYTVHHDTALTANSLVSNVIRKGNLGISVYCPIGYMCPYLCICKSHPASQYRCNSTKAW